VGGIQKNHLICILKQPHKIRISGELPETEEKQFQDKALCAKKRLPLI